MNSRSLVSLVPGDTAHVVQVSRDHLLRPMGGTDLALRASDLSGIKVRQ